MWLNRPLLYIDRADLGSKILQKGELGQGNMVEWYRSTKPQFLWKPQLLKTLFRIR